MKFAAWLACWPLLAVFGAFAFVTDSLIDVCEGLDHLLERLEEFSESGDA
jgi:hypothetical protein